MSAVWMSVPRVYQDRELIENAAAEATDMGVDECGEQMRDV
jgi:hypothetical protein